MELSQENFDKLAGDMDGLKGALRTVSGDLKGLKGAIGEFKRSQTMLASSVFGVGALFFAALVFVGTQVSGLDTRVDAVVGGLAEVKTGLKLVDNELNATNLELTTISQRLLILEDIRDRIKDLALVSPPDGAEGDLIGEGDRIEGSRIADLQTDQPGAPKGSGAVYRGVIDPVEFAELVKRISESQPNVRMIGAESMGRASSLAYLPQASLAHLPEDWASAWDQTAPLELDESLLVEANKGIVITLPGSQPDLTNAEVVRVVEINTMDDFSAEISAAFEELGLVVISTDNEILRRIAKQHGVEFR